MCLKVIHHLLHLTGYKIINDKISINYTCSIRSSTIECAKVFQTGRSQAVRLPKAFRFNGTEVAIKSFGRGVLLMPIDNPWDVMLEALNEFEVGFKLERADQGEQVREDFK